MNRADNDVCPDTELRSAVDEVGRSVDRVKVGERFLQVVIEDQERRLRRVEDLGIETRAMIGERELRVREFLVRAQELARAYADGLQDLVREW